MRIESNIKKQGGGLADAAREGVTYRSPGLNPFEDAGADPVEVFACMPDTWMDEIAWASFEERGYIGCGRVKGVNRTEDARYLEDGRENLGKES